jgi:ribonuclease HI
LLVEAIGSKSPAMTVSAPHFHLYAEAAPAPHATDAGLSSRWRFVLRLPGGESSFEATDEEPQASPERLELLAIIRGLEALEQPSRVTLFTASREIRRGLDFGLVAWRENDWQWERFGRMTPVKNGDLWRRLDRLLEIHSIDVRPTRLERADDLASPRKITLNGRRLRFDDAECETSETSCPRSAWARKSGRSAARRTAGRRASSQFRPAQSVGRRETQSGWAAVVGFVLRLLCPATRPAPNQRRAAAWCLRPGTTEEMARA